VNFHHETLRKEEAGSDPDNIPDLTVLGYKLSNDRSMWKLKVKLEKPVSAQCVKI